MHFPSPSQRLLAIVVLLMTLAAPMPAASAQSLLDRPDNISTDWVGNSGTVYFNFVHRFSVSSAPDRKVTNFPTFLVATGIASRALVGFNYATNSSLAARYPNEYEFFARYAPLQQEEGAAFDLGGQVDYNLAVKGVDGELSIARREGPARLAAVARLVADTLGGNKARFAFGGGGTLRFGRFIALAGDATSLTDRQPGEKVAWSAGLHLALPNTPHTLSLHVSNATTSTIQGLSRGGDTRRWGFEFTVPVHLDRLFGGPADTAAPAPPVASSRRQPDVTVPDSVVAAPRPARTAPADTTASKPTRDVAAAPTAPAPARTTKPATTAPARAAQPSVFRARMKGSAYLPNRIEVEAGTTVQWKNLDALIHTVTAVDKSFDSGVIAADGSYSHTFTKAGSYPVYCVAHPFMKATIVVK
ncbi:MAG: cupredoxin domain-containing protein [Gemmatimonadaceae bacterium]